jgi:hypothetical protein
MTFNTTDPHNQPNGIAERPCRAALPSGIAERPCRAALPNGLAERRAEGVANGVAKGVAERACLQHRCTSGDSSLYWRMNRFFRFAPLILLFQAPLLAQTWDVRFLPESLLVPPFAAHYQEPRTGLRKEIATSRMKLDIGSTIDVVHIALSDDDRTRLSVGIDFFTYALTTSSEGLRLQVDAVDGFFGGHVAYRADFEHTSLALRLRLLHLSAHLIDGHYDIAQKAWKDGRDPIPFTKDFGEITAAYEWGMGGLRWMGYGGLAYATLIRPAGIERVSTLQGIQVRTGDMGGTAFGKPVTFYVADNLTLVGIPEYVGTNNVEMGVKFGRWDGRGVRLYVSYWSGLEVFSQYYDVRRNHWGAGFAYDVW